MRMHNWTCQGGTPRVFEGRKSGIVVISSAYRVGISWSAHCRLPWPPLTCSGVSILLAWGQTVSSSTPANQLPPSAPPRARPLALPRPRQARHLLPPCDGLAGHNSSVVTSGGSLVRRVGDEHPAMRVSKATSLRLLQRDELTRGLAPEGLEISTDVAT